MVIRLEILSVIRNINPNKAHENGQISIPMLPICDKPVFKPLYLNFSSCIESGIFPTK